MKLILSKSRILSILAISLTSVTAFSFLIVPSAMAGKNAGEALIDGEFEEAMLGHFERRFYRSIDATEEEKTALSAIFLKQIQSTRADREAIRHKLVDLSDLVAADGTSDAQIKEKVAEVRAMREKVMDSRVETVLKVRQILTPEQRKIVGERITNLLSGHGPLRKRLSSSVE